MDAAGVPLSIAVDGANVHDMHLVGANLLELDSLPVRRPSPRRVKQGLCLDKGYDYPIVREVVAAFGFVGHIRSRGEERKALKKSRGMRPRRWVVERAHSWYNRFRGLLVRWCKKDDNYMAQLHLASALIIGSLADLFG